MATCRVPGANLRKLGYNYFDDFRDMTNAFACTEAARENKCGRNYPAGIAALLPPACAERSCSSKCKSLVSGSNYHTSILESMSPPSKDNMLAGILNGMIGPGAGRLGPRDSKVGGGPSGAP